MGSYLMKGTVDADWYCYSEPHFIVINSEALLAWASSPHIGNTHAMHLRPVWAFFGQQDTSSTGESKMATETLLEQNIKEVMSCGCWEQILFKERRVCKKTWFLNRQLRFFQQAKLSKNSCGVAENDLRVKAGRAFVWLCPCSSSAQWLL